MSSLVVFDSYFGNTEMVARAVAEVLGRMGPVRALRVSEVESGHLDGVTLVVVGSPTRSFGPSPAIRAWLAKLPPGRLAGVRVAAFDTRVDPASVRNGVSRALARWLGSAASPIAKGLVRAGGLQAAPVEGFLVEGATGPLAAGETDRAREWARALSSPATDT